MSKRATKLPDGASQLVALGILASKDRVLITRRTGEGPLSGLWEFPGGKVEFGEHPWQALRRELREELSITVTRGHLAGVYSHVYESPQNRLHVILIAYRVPVARSLVKDAMDRTWADLNKLAKWPFVPGSRPIVDDLVRGRLT